MKEELITISPIDGSEFVRRPYASESQIEQTLKRAQTAQKAWAARSLSEHLALVGRAVELFVENKATIAEAITRQMGRPLRYTAGEVDGFAARARHMMAIAEDALKPVQVEPQAGLTRYISRDPVGVVLTIAPWNYPLLTAVNSIVPALLAGNAVFSSTLIKHRCVPNSFIGPLCRLNFPRASSSTCMWIMNVCVD